MMIGLLLLSCNVASCNVPTGLLQQPQDTLRLYAVGDVNLGRRMAKERLLAGDTLYPFRALLDTLRGADITFGNLESPIAPDSNRVGETPLVFTAPSAAAAALTRAWNPAPYAFYQHAGAKWIAWGDASRLYPAIRALKASGRVDLIVVSVHGGQEYVEAPPQYHRDLLYGLVDAGADVILAHHPHVLQPVVWYRGKPIVQSLGNFVFLQDDPWTRLSAILRVMVAPDKTIRLSAVPVRVSHQPTLATGAAADSVRQRLGVPLSAGSKP